MALFCGTVRASSHRFPGAQAGIPPTTKHLGEIISSMQKENARIILNSPYFDPKPAQFVADKTGGRVVGMVHQSGAAEGAGGYIAMVDYNVRQVVEALKEH